MKWFERPAVLDYIINCYAGVETVGGTGFTKRQFIWEDEEHNIVVGNSRAFSDHVSKKFDLGLSDTTWCSLNKMLHAMGEVARATAPKVNKLGGKFKNLEPEVRIIKRKS